MKTFWKQPCLVKFKFKSNARITARSGVVPINALAHPFGLAEKIRALAALDPRKRKGSGFAPEAIATQVVYALCSGGTSLADVEQMGRVPAWTQGVFAIYFGPCGSVPAGSWHFVDFRGPQEEDVAGWWEATGGGPGGSPS